MADSPAYNKAPAYQYYPDNFEQGTATFTLAEVGAYQRLLNYQWTNGSIPADSMTALSRILRCTLAVAKTVWETIGPKFDRGDDGQWRNARMERERQKQADRRAALVENGKRGGAAKAKAIANATVLPEQKPSLSSPSSSPTQYVPPKNGGTYARGGLITSPLDYAKQHEKCTEGFCDWCCFPKWLFNKFRASADWDEAQVLEWAKDVRASWTGARGDELDFWRARWREKHPQAATVETKTTRTKAALGRFIERHS